MSGGPNISLEMDTKVLQYRLKGLKAGLADLSPVWRGPVYRIFQDFIKVHFDSGGSYSGDQWAPLSPRYAAWKEKHYPGKGILRREDDLFKSLQDGPDKVLRVTPDSAEMGTSVPYAVYHQAKDRGKAPFPRREVIPPLTRQEGTRIVDAILAFLFKSMRTGGTGGRGF